MLRGEEFFDPEELAIGVGVDQSGSTKRSG
jgi:hypothetical protein